MKAEFQYNPRQEPKTIVKKEQRMISEIFERFVEQTPLTVMVMGIMERSFGREQLEKLLEETAEEQYTKTLLFSIFQRSGDQVVNGQKTTLRLKSLATK